MDKITNSLKLLCLYPATYEDLRQKGVLHLALEKDENGFFGKVFHVFFPTPLTREIRLNSVHTIVEIGRKCEFLFHWGSGFSQSGVALNLFVYIFKTIMLAVKEKVDIIRAQTPYLEGLCGLIVSKVLNIPFCVSIHSDYDKRYELDGKQGAPAFFGSRKIANNLERFVLAHTKMVMPIRESLGEYAIRNGARKEAIRVIPHGIDINPFLNEPNPDFKKAIGIPSDKKIVSFVGRFSKENYIYDLIPIAEGVKKIREDIVFVLAGGGVEETNFKQELEKRNLTEMFKLLGFQPREKIIELRLNSDIALCLMGGYSLIEPAVADKPVIAYDVEWHYELVINNQTGFLVKEGDIEKIVESILTLMDNTELRLHLGKNARELAIKRHSIEYTSKIKIKCYKKLLMMYKKIKHCSIEEEIEVENCWYTDDQFSAAASEHYKRANTKRTEIMKEIIKQYYHPGMKMFDAGCGDGVNLKLLTSFPQSEVYATDFNSLRVERVKTKFPGVTVSTGDLTKLPFTENFFNFILLNQVIEHISEDKTVLQELNRVLKPQGILLIGIPNEGCFLAQLRNKILEREILCATDHVNFYTEKKFQQLVDETLMFETIKVIREGFFPPHQKLQYFLACSNWGYEFMTKLGRIFPTQCNSLYFVLQKKG